MQIIGSENRTCLLLAFLPLVYIIDLVSVYENLLLLLQFLDELDWDFECRSDEISWCKSEPLSQWDIGNAVRLVDFNPDKLFSIGSVFNVMSAGDVSFLQTRT